MNHGDQALEVSPSYVQLRQRDTGKMVRRPAAMKVARTGSYAVSSISYLGGVFGQGHREVCYYVSGEHFYLIGIDVACMMCFRWLLCWSACRVGSN